MFQVAAKHTIPEPRHIDTHRAAISSVRFSPDGKRIIIGGEDGTVRPYEVDVGSDHTGTEMEIPAHAMEVSSAQIVSRDGRWIILTADKGRRIAVWDTITHKRTVESAMAHEQTITTLDVSSDASKIASGSRDGAVIVWCLETGQRLAGPFQQEQSVLSVRFSPGGDRLASSGWNFSIRVWNICSDGNQAVAYIPTEPAYSLAWSSDGRRLTAGCYRGSIVCFDVSSSTPTTPNWPNHPHFDSISTLRLSNNNRFIISASGSDCSVKIWDVHGRSELGSLKHSGEVLDADISPNDWQLVSGTRDGKITLWDIRKVLPAHYFFYVSFASCLIRHPVLSHWIVFDCFPGVLLSFGLTSCRKLSQLFEIWSRSHPSSCER